MTDIFMISVNGVVLSDKVPRNNGKDWHYIVGYQVDEETSVPMFIRMPNNIFSYDISQYDKNFSYTM